MSASQTKSSFGGIRTSSEGVSWDARKENTPDTGLLLEKGSTLTTTSTTTETAIGRESTGGQTVTDVHAAKTVTTTYTDRYGNTTTTTETEREFIENATAEAAYIPPIPADDGNGTDNGPMNFNVP